MNKVCPILQAGRMLFGLGTRNGGHSVKGDVEFSARTNYNMTSHCMTEECEWFENGCPAHRGQDNKSLHLLE